MSMACILRARVSRPAVVSDRGGGTAANRNRAIIGIGVIVVSMVRALRSCGERVREGVGMRRTRMGMGNDCCRSRCTPSSTDSRLTR